MIDHAREGEIASEETSEIVLKALILVLVVGHVDRQRVAHDQLTTLRAQERKQAELREVTDRADSIAVHAEANQMHLVITVRDGGLGIPPTDLNRIFETF